MRLTNPIISSELPKTSTPYPQSSFVNGRSFNFFMASHSVASSAALLVGSMLPNLHAHAESSCPLASHTSVPPAPYLSAEPPSNCMMRWPLALLTSLKVKLLPVLRLTSTLACCITRASMASEAPSWSCWWAANSSPNAQSLGPTYHSTWYSVRSTSKACSLR